MPLKYLISLRLHKEKIPFFISNFIILRRDKWRPILLPFIYIIFLSFVAWLVQEKCLKLLIAFFGYYFTKMHDGKSIIMFKILMNFINHIDNYCQSYNKIKWLAIFCIHLKKTTFQYWRYVKGVEAKQKENVFINQTAAKYTVNKFILHCTRGKNIHVKCPGKLRFLSKIKYKIADALNEVVKQRMRVSGRQLFWKISDIRKEMN